MLHMIGVYQGDEEVDVQQKGRQGNSSLKRFTISSVTGFPPFFAASNEMPLRTGFALRALLVSPCRASAEMISPMLLCSRSAKCRAAERTSSSMASVVRMAGLSLLIG